PTSGRAVRTSRCWPFSRRLRALRTSSSTAGTSSAPVSSLASGSMPKVNGWAGEDRPARLIFAALCQPHPLAPSPSVIDGEGERGSSGVRLLLQSIDGPGSWLQPHLAGVAGEQPRLRIEPLLRRVRRDG